MAPRTPSRIKLEQELEAIKSKIAEAEKREAKRLGELAIKTGLAALELDEEVVVAEFKAMVDRFRPDQGSENGQGKKQRGPARQRKADQSATASQPDPASEEAQDAPGAD